MLNICQPTYFAPAERTPPAKLQAQYQRLCAEPVIRKLMDSFPEPAVVLNRQRMIVLANDKFAQMLDRRSEQFLGLRLGEAVQCVHAFDEPAGCGTTEFCQYCGAVNAMVHCLEHHAPESEECRITRHEKGETNPLDLRVWATPITIGGELYMVFAVRDITDEKRRLVLERIFFHDLLNLAGGLRGLLDLWPALTGSEALEIESAAQRLAEQMLEEIESQRDLAAAERGDLPVDIHLVNVESLLSSLLVLYSHHTCAVGKKVAPPAFSGVRLIPTDERLLRRVLGNLIKNALEASEPGQTVEVAFVNQDDRAVFTVHNENTMPEEVRLQLFQRSFSTKPGPGHGIGSYSVKLLTERYLRGKVSFTSDKAKGTTFVVELPAICM